jgi:RNA polymerase sigma factor (sigma-70 family)
MVAIPARSCHGQWSAIATPSDPCWNEALVRHRQVGRSGLHCSVSRDQSGRRRGESWVAVQRFAMSQRRWLSMEPIEMALGDESYVYGSPLAVVTAVSEPFEVFFARECRPMVRLAFSLIDSQERAEEIVQDGFEKTLLAWRRLETPGAYLRRCVVNGCHSELRRRQVVRRSPKHAERQWTETSDDAYLFDALAQLTPKRRVALTLRFYADLPEADIAAAMNVRLGTVKSLIHRGLADLRKVVER